MRDLIAVSGLPGLYKIIANKGNGVIVEDLDNGKNQFVSMRIKNAISPLETIAIYTYEDSISLIDVLKTMKAQFTTNPPVDHNSDGDTLRAYFKTILPDFNDFKVKNNDIKKIIKWFGFLNQRNLIVDDVEAEKTEEGKPVEKKETKVKTATKVDAKKNTGKISTASKSKPIMNSKKMG